jgi:dihydrodipicolinate synthase/N-acetylneuraminate lyase
MSSIPRTDDIKGFIAPIPTAFDGHGEPDLPLIESMVEFFLEAGVHAFFVLGSLGMGPVCTNEQRAAVAETIIHRVGRRVPVIVQVGATEPYSSMELATHAEAAGADAIAVVGPYYFNNRTEWELIEHYKLIGSASKLPMLLYNNPLYSGYPCPPDLMRKIREAVPTVFGAKLARGNPAEALRYLEVLGNEFAAFAPIEVMVPGMQIGLRGSIAAGPVAIVPEIGVALLEACLVGNTDLALRLQVLMLKYYNRQDYFWRTYGRNEYAEGWRLRGFDVKEYPRWPVKPVSAEDRRKYEENLRRVFAEAAEVLGRNVRLANH